MADSIPDFEELDDFELNKIEIENRIKNLMWTVSGDYKLDICPDVESFKLSKYISLYDAIKQGAIAKYFDRDELSLYIVKKVFLSGDEDYLLYIMQLCMEVAIQSFKGRVIGVTLPNSVELKVTECEPSVKGNTATGATKMATVETGYTVRVPLFINEGDVLRIDTRTGAYIERA